MAYKTKEEFLTWNEKKPVLLSEQDFSAPELSSEDYLELISELIRLDIPILEIGSSSIGKSYSIREMLKASGIKGEFLFVGTEKAEFIEGIPNLKATEKRTEELKTKSGATAAKVTEEVGEKFTYLKPYWFPNKVEIANRLGSGRRQLENISSLIPGATGAKMAQMWSYVQGKGGGFEGQNAFGVLETLKVMLLDYKKSEAEIKKEKMAEKESGKKAGFESQYTYADALQYISMIQGYGNFWLILDEIDKVSEPDKDKYAPLLHIVRERELKGWKLSGIREYPEYDPKFVSDITIRIENLNKALDLVAQGVDIDLTDTRIIAIANDLRTLEKASPALYRRFVKIAIEKTLMVEKKLVDTGASDEEKRLKEIERALKDPANAYNSVRYQFNKCIEVKPIQKEAVIGGKKVSSITVKEDMAYIQPNLLGKPLDELNLQWTLGFFPEILFPGQAIDAIMEPTSIPNKIIENFNNENEVRYIWLYKILIDNFETKYVQPLMICANQLIGKKKITPDTRELRSEMDADEILSAITDYNNPDKGKVITDVIERYKKILGFTSEAFQKIFEEQKGGSGISSGVEDSTNTVYNTGKMKIITGSLMIEKSFIDGKPTKLTNLLMSSIPFVQQSFLAHNPYISTEVSRQFQSDIDESMTQVIEKLGGDTTSSDALASAVRKIEMDEQLVNLYGYGITDELYEKIKKVSPAQTEDALKQKDEILDEIVANKPVMILLAFARKLSQKQKYKYISNSSTWLLAEKEVLMNLTEILIYHSVRYPSDANSMVEMTHYAMRFPYSVKNFIDNVELYKNVPELMNADKKPLYDSIRTVADKSIADGEYSNLDVVNA